MLHSHQQVTFGGRSLSKKQKSDPRNWVASFCAFESPVAVASLGNETNDKSLEPLFFQGSMFAPRRVIFGKAGMALKAMDDA